MSAFPVGPVFAWIASVPGIAQLIDLVWTIARGRTSRFFGLTSAAVDEKGRARAADAAPELTPALGDKLRRLGRLARSGLREAAVLVMLAAAVNQALVELWSTKKPWSNLITSLNQTGSAQELGVSLSPQPEIMRTLSQKLRFLQGWFMFSPNPVMDDGTIVVDAVTVDGRHVDPFWNREPNFDLIHMKSCRYNQIWSDYFNRMHFAGNRNYYDPMLDYMRRLPERTGHPNDALVSGEVY
ncbi:MAG TPA: hypothetical protein VL400_07945, partial [Polyangiaceae bacterium]|nr:hypothetical protein [Polyangiaceae bacterium]